MIKNFKIAFLSLLFFNLPCIAGETNYPVIRWDTLGLSYSQQAKMQTIDAKWQRINFNLRNRIYNDQQELKFILASPCSTDNDVREKQNRLLNDKKMLKYQAMEIFLEKRSILTPEQRKLLLVMF